MSLRNWTFRDVRKFLHKNGFHLERKRGSHFHFVKNEKHPVTVQNHGNKSIPIGTMNSIIRQSGIPKEEWRK